MVAFVNCWKTVKFGITTKKSGVLVCVHFPLSCSLSQGNNTATFMIAYCKAKALLSGRNLRNVLPNPKVRRYF